MQAAARSLIGKVDAIYVPTDNTIVSALESAVGVANEAKLPLYAADTDSVARGALAAVGFNYFDVGVQTAALVDRVLKGENPGSIPVVFAAGTDLQVNKATAAAIGVRCRRPCSTARRRWSSSRGADVREAARLRTTSRR